ncbi:MAG: peptide deformylase [Leptospiraceae bacterium]|nr:peptide deformylase [Leptospiraceae bacterium]
MAVRKILTIPDPVLYQKAEPVAKFDRKLRGLARDMFETMYEASGVGLAAVQIGVLQRLLVIDLEDQGFIKGVFINPEVLEVSEEMQEGEEGCLSVPGLSVPHPRPRWVKIGYQDLNGTKRTVEGEMLLARAFLHEMDHLDGKVFVDQLEPDMKLEFAEDIERIKAGKPPRESKKPAYRRARSA